MEGGLEDYLDVEDALDLLGESCTPEDSEGCNDTTFIDTLSISIPVYTGCTFVVAFNFWTCQAGTLIDYTFGDYQIIHHNCPAFETALVSAYTAGGITFSNFVESVDFEIYKAIENYFIANYSNPQQHICGSGQLFSITYLRASCYKYCIIQLPNNTANLLKIACGTDCCQIHTTACYRNGVLETDTYLVTPSPPSCPDPSYLPPGLGDNQFVRRCENTTSCLYTCPDLD